jgi:hypothetical protein
MRIKRTPNPIAESTARHRARRRNTRNRFPPDANIDDGGECHSTRRDPLEPRLRRGIRWPAPRGRGVSMIAGHRD